LFLLLKSADALAEPVPRKGDGPRLVHSNTVWLKSNRKGQLMSDHKDPFSFFKNPFNIVPADKSGCGVPLLSVAIVLVSAASAFRLLG
jgi:hypothetical protein